MAWSILMTSTLMAYLRALDNESEKSIVRVFPLVFDVSWFFGSAVLVTRHPDT